MNYDYVTRILDVNRELIEFARDQVSISTTRQLNQATEVVITVPSSAPLKLGIGSFVQRVRIKPDAEPEVVATGRISRRDVEADTITYTAFLDAILLSNNVTPANYSNALTNLLLEDLARMLVDGWRTLRADLTNPFAQSNVDLTTEPGRVMLAKDGTGAYRPAGSVTLRFDSNTVAAWKGWDRIRWESDYYDNVKTTMQWRSGATTGSLGAWSAELQGADPAGMGVALAGVTDRFVEVRINLSTEDTETPQDVPEGETPTAFGFTPRVFGVELIARTVGEIEIGNIDVADDVFVRNVEADSSNSLRILQEACEATKHEFNVVNGKLDLGKKLGRDRTNDHILQAGGNIDISILRDDDDEMVNRLHAYGDGEGLSRPYVFREDAASIAQYGPYEATETFDARTLPELITAADAHLAEHSRPSEQFEVTGLDVFALDLGDKVRIADPASGLVVTTRATELTETEDAEGKTLTALLGDPPRGLVQQILDQVDEDKKREYELALSPPNVRARRSHPGFTIEVGHAPRSRGVGFIVHFSAERGFTPSSGSERTRGQQTTFNFPDVAQDAIYYVRVAAYDRLGEVSEFSPELPVKAGKSVEPGSISITELADTLVPPLIEYGLPSLPSLEFPAGSKTIIFEAQEGKLYRLSEDGLEWEALVNTRDLVGVITETQISDDAISTPKLAAEAIVAGKIAADAVTAGTIAAAAIAARELQADAVTAGKINANAVTARELQADSVVAAKIKAGEVKAEHLDAGSVTAVKIAAGAITTEKLTAGTVDLTNSSRTNAKLRVLDGSNNRTQIGKLTNASGNALPGVPTNDRYGIWLPRNELYVQNAGLIYGMSSGLTFEAIKTGVPATGNANTFDYFLAASAEVGITPPAERPLSLVLSWNGGIMEWKVAGASEWEAHGSPAYIAPLVQYRSAQAFMGGQWVNGSPLNFNTFTVFNNPNGLPITKIRVGALMRVRLPNWSGKRDFRVLGYSTVFVSDYTG